MSVIIATILNGNEVCLTSDTRLSDSSDPHNIRRTSGYKKLHKLASGHHVFGFTGSVILGEQIVKLIKLTTVNLNTTPSIVHAVKEAREVVLKNMLKPEDINEGREQLKLIVAGIDVGSAYIQVFDEKNELEFRTHGQVAFLLPPKCAPVEAQQKLIEMLPPQLNDLTSVKMMKIQEKFVKEYVSLVDESVDNKTVSIILR